MAGGESAPRPSGRRPRRALARRFAPTLVRAINATGVLLHTNLGRAPLPAPARAAIAGGGRGIRDGRVRPGAAARGASGRTTSARSRATSSRAATRSPSTTTPRPSCSPWRRWRADRSVLVSRGELVAIGGSFKIPEILEASGARLREVGTTNRTTADDYRRAFASRGRAAAVGPSLQLRDPRLHGGGRRRASSRCSRARPACPGCTTRAPARSCRSTSSACPTSRPSPSVSTAGADLVDVLGDKLFSGPQAGFLAGQRRAGRAERPRTRWRARCGPTS